MKDVDFGYMSIFAEGKKANVIKVLENMTKLAGNKICHVGVGIKEYFFKFRDTLAANTGLRYK